MDENFLEVGKIYETILGAAPGRALYMGKIRGNSTQNNHTIIFRGEELRFIDNNPHKGVTKVVSDRTECWRFKDYSIEDGKLKVIYGVEKELSKSEREYIDQRVIGSGL